MNKFEFSRSYRIQFVFNINPVFGEPSSALCLIGGFQLETELLVRGLGVLLGCFALKLSSLLLVPGVGFPSSLYGTLLPKHEVPYWDGDLILCVVG